MAEGEPSTPVNNCRKFRLRMLYPKVTDIENTLPKTWCLKDKYSNVGTSVGGLRVQLTKTNESNKEGTTVKANTWIPSSAGLYYFELKIVSKGREGSVAIGLTTPCVSYFSLLGMDKHSYAYNGSEGNICNSKSDDPYGPTFTTGDIVGCGVNFVYNTCFFTKNGHYLGVAFKDLPSKQLYPTVGLHAIGAVVDANFGHMPFLFDIEDMMKEMKAKAKDIVHNFTFPSSDGEYQGLMHKLVNTYLLHNGYCATAQKFASDTGQPLAENIEAIQNRKSIMNLVSSGKIEEAINNTQRFYPGLLEGKPNLLFRLKCRQFIEMINSNSNSNGINGDLEYMETETNGYELCNGRLSSMERILEFGRELHSLSNSLCRDHGSNRKNKSMLRNAFSLLAYSNPHNSPVGWQLNPSQREEICTELNCAILKECNASVKPPLEFALAHAKNLLSLMCKSGIGLAAFIDINDYM